LWKVLIFFPALGFKFIALRAASGRAMEKLLRYDFFADPEDRAT